MNKILSFRIVPHYHRFQESELITLVTKRSHLEFWLFGLCFSFNVGFHANYNGYYN
jgi:hypothetical protein